MSPGDFLNSFFPAVECKLPLQDLTFGQNKIIVIVHNSNDPRNCVVYSVILNRDTNRDIASSSDLSSHLNTNKSNLRAHQKLSFTGLSRQLTRSSAVWCRDVCRAIARVTAISCYPDIMDNNATLAGIVNILMTDPCEPPSLTCPGRIISPAIVLHNHNL